MLGNLLGGGNDILVRVGIADTSKLNGQLNTMSSNISSSFGKMLKSIDPVTVAIGAAVAAIASMAVVTKKAIDSAASFETQMANVNTLLDETDTNFQALNDGILDLATELPVEIDTLTKGLYDLISAGVDSGSAIDSLELAGKAATAGITSVDSAVRAGMANVNAYGLSVDELTRVYDLQFSTVKYGVLTYEDLAGSIGNVLPSAAALGVSLEDLYGSISVITKGGIEARSATTFLARAFESMVENRDKWEDLGVAIFDAQGKFRGLQPIIGELSMELSGLTTEQKQMKLETLDMEKRSAKAILTMVNNYEGFSKTMNDVADSSDAMNIAFEKQAGTLENQQKLLENILQVLLIELGTAFLPLLKEMAGLLIENKDLIILTFTLFVKAVEPALKIMSANVKIINASVDATRKLSGIVSSLVPNLKKKSETESESLDTTKKLNDEIAITAAGFDMAYDAILNYNDGLKNSNKGTKDLKDLFEELGVVTENEVRGKLELLQSTLSKVNEGSYEYEQLIKQITEEQKKLGIEALEPLNINMLEFKTHMNEGSKEVGTLEQVQGKLNDTLKVANNDWIQYAEFLDKVISRIPALDEGTKNVVLSLKDMAITFAKGDFLGFAASAFGLFTQSVHEAAWTLEYTEQRLENVGISIDGMKESLNELTDVMTKGTFDDFTFWIEFYENQVRLAKDETGYWADQLERMQNLLITMESPLNMVNSLDELVSKTQTLGNITKDFINLYSVNGELDIGIQSVKQGYQGLYDSLFLMWQDVSEQMRDTPIGTEAYAELEAAQNSLYVSFGQLFTAAGMTREEFLALNGNAYNLNSTLYDSSMAAYNHALAIEKDSEAMEHNTHTIEQGSAAYVAAMTNWDIYKHLWTGTTSEVMNFAQAMGNAGIETEKFVREQIAGWEALLPSLTEGSYEWEQLVQKINAGYIKLGEKSPWDDSTDAIEKHTGAIEQGSAAYAEAMNNMDMYKHLWTGTTSDVMAFSQAMASAGIETEVSVRAQITEWERWIPYLVEGSYEYGQLVEKLNSAYAKLGETSPWETNTAAIEANTKAMRENINAMIDRADAARVVFDQLGEAIGYYKDVETIVDGERIVETIMVTFEDATRVIMSELGSGGNFFEAMSGATDVISDMLMFNVDLDTTYADESMMQLIQTSVSWLNTLSPSSPLYQMASQALGDLVAKYNELGTEDIMINIDPTTALASVGLVTASVDDIEDTKNINVSNYSANSSIDALNTNVGKLEDTQTVTVYTYPAIQAINYLKTSIDSITTDPIYFTAITGSAIQAINYLRDAINSIPRSITITASYHDGGLILHSGGMVVAHEGTMLGTYKGRKEVPVLATQGEYVLRPEVMQAFGLGAVDRLNNNLDPSGFGGNMVQPIIETTDENIKVRYDRHYEPRRRQIERQRIKSSI